MKLAGRIPHPIPYQGSKRGLAGEILSHVPGHVRRLVEPFAGSAAISLAAAQRGLADRFWINDANGPLVDLWREIIERPRVLADEYRRLWELQRGRERVFFDDVRQEFNRTHRPADFLYLLARCVKGAVRYNARGEFNNTADNRRRGARPDEMAARLRGASELLRGRVRLTALDYREVIDQCGADDLIYLDPPYQGVTTGRDSRYGPTVEHEEFREALDRLNGRHALYLVSYDGRTGEQRYGTPLPAELGLTHLEIRAGRSSQATLLGRDAVTYESLYLSAALHGILAVEESLAMNRVIVESRIGSDGVLHVPVGRSAANKDVRVTIEPIAARTSKAARMTQEGWLEFLSSTAGAWQGDFERPEQGECEERDPFP